MTAKSTARPGLWHQLTMRLKDNSARPYFDYVNILITVALLATIGLIMVSSAAVAKSEREANSVWTLPLHQLTMVSLGFVALWAALKIRPQVVRRLSSAILAVSILLLILVLIPQVGTGLAETGSQSWITLGPLTIQPSEIARVAIVMWGADKLAGKKLRMTSMHEPLVQYLVVSAVMAMLIVAEHDLGMAISFMLVVVVLLFLVGVDIRFLGAMGMLLVIGVIGLSLFSTQFRKDRITVFLNIFWGKFEDSTHSSFQSYQGLLSIAEGGITGVGIGQSRAKWFYLPEAHNDFIFAIVGEEIGLIGGVLLISLFAWLGYIGLRIAQKSSSPYLSLLSSTLVMAVVLQAFINIAYVVALLPVTGIQLPMISSGGTSAIITLGAMGLVASAARHESDAISAMQANGRPWIDRVLLLPEPHLEGLDRPGAARPRTGTRASHTPITRQLPARNQRRTPPQPTQPRQARGRRHMNGNSLRRSPRREYPRS
ncbi:putative lipid II flippase FtsW [Corynebacterium sp. ES2794-CONJ1]|uniref:peptidoglycan glycosyltransferase FtsW n=1 Tax=unclassified Corynebacterium TaxID=2624378 RepID=UPI00216914FB|nr:MULTISPECIES: putative peptidoglycan glycosyltransferase FtsW [unclassified Corynebacterium]MCS4490827.1 putative lipid II flippase FtsW [Corynebacterium sp. ES2715-CONJ3]MCS4531290.1 putative lipid II flippase FtsW [Corynebacterium sp. ES2730-CONJ]MCU9518659.1 putative lipid II flippase FtsW [Corynebacterium sp. ES2794-CONJ1]